jgi:hypothetical protein
MLFLHRRAATTDFGAGASSRLAGNRWFSRERRREGRATADSDPLLMKIRFPVAAAGGDVRLVKPPGTRTSQRSCFCSASMPT